MHGLCNWVRNNCPECRDIVISEVSFKGGFTMCTLYTVYVHIVDKGAVVIIALMYIR